MTSFNLLELDGIIAEVTETSLKGGRYDMIRMHIVEGLKFTNATLAPGSEPFAVRVPSEKIKIPVEFDIEVGKTTMVILDTETNDDWRIAIANNPEHNLNPVIGVLTKVRSPREHLADCVNVAICPLWRRHQLSCRNAPQETLSIFSSWVCFSLLCCGQHPTPTRTLAQGSMEILLRLWLITLAAVLNRRKTE